MPARLRLVRRWIAATRTSADRRMLRDVRTVLKKQHKKEEERVVTLERTTIETSPSKLPSLRTQTTLKTPSKASGHYTLKDDIHFDVPPPDGNCLSRDIEVEVRKRPQSKESWGEGEAEGSRRKQKEAEGSSRKL